MEANGVIPQDQLTLAELRGLIYSLTTNVSPNARIFIGVGDTPEEAGLDLRQAVIDAKADLEPDDLPF